MMEENNWLLRQEMLIGKENTEKLKNATVAIFGLGGVGSYVCEALVRAGAKYTHLLVEPQAVPMLRERFRAIQLARRIQVGEKIFCDYKCYDGSSKFDTKEMHDLIETILDMASECGLDIVYWKDVLDFED